MHEKIRVGSLLKIQGRKYKVVGISWETLGPSKIIVFYLNEGDRELVWEDYKGNAGPHRVNFYLSQTERIDREQLTEELKTLERIEEGKIKIEKTVGFVPFLVNRKGKYIICLDKTRKTFVLFEIYGNLILRNTTKVISEKEIEKLS